MPAVPPRSPFVGRARETAALDTALAEAARGSGRIFLIAGEPGIGKTRLAEELAALAPAHGAQTFWGRCWESSGAPAFWPWIEALRGLVRATPHHELAEDLGDGAADIARLLPEVAAARTSESSTGPDDHAEARFRLFDALCNWLRAASERRPLLLVLDDLHWADAASLSLLQFLARAINPCRLLLIATYREGEAEGDHPFAAALAALQRYVVVDTLKLRGLSAPEVAVLIGMPASAGPATAGLAQELYSRTDGNPFFVQQMLRHMRENTEHSPGADLALRATSANGLPDSVRGVLAQRLARLSAPCYEVLTIAAVLGREFSLAALRACVAETGGSEDAVLDALDEAEAARVVAAVEPASGGYRFVHALVREVLYESLTSVRRMRLHLRAGVALGTLYGADPEQHLSELAGHFLLAGPDGAARAVRFAELAAERAAGQLAYEEAARLYRLALQASELTPSVDSVRRCALLLAFGEMASRAGDLATAREAFANAADLARGRGDAEQFALAALGFGGLVVQVGVVDERLCALLEEALALLPEDDDALRVRVQARLGMELLYSTDRQRRETISAAAVAAARRAGASPALAYALHARHYAIWEPATLNERLAIAREIIEIGEQTGDIDLALQGRRWLIPDLIERGERREADAEIDRCGRQAEAVRRPLFRWYTAVFRGAQAILDGRYDGAERLLAEQEELGQRAQAGTAQIYAMAQRFAIGRDRGDFGPVERWARRDAGPTLPALTCMAAWICANSGREEEARALLAMLAADSFAAVRRDLTWLGNAATLADLCFDLRTPAHAAVLYEQLRPYAGRSAVFGIPVATGPTDLALALLAATTGRSDVALRHAADALRFAQRMQAPPWQAWSEYRWGQILASNATEQGETDGHLQHAATIAERLGMGLLLRRIGAERSALEARPVRFPAGLTAREVEVLRLIAAGRTTREIAAALVISLPTVERHITNLYTKIGARGRAQATAFALTHRLGAST